MRPLPRLLMLLGTLAGTTAVLSPAGSALAQSAAEVLVRPVLPWQRCRIPNVGFIQTARQKLCLVGRSDGIYRGENAAYIETAAPGGGEPDGAGWSSRTSVTPTGTTQKTLIRNPMPPLAP